MKRSILLVTMVFFLMLMFVACANTSDEHAPSDDSSVTLQEHEFELIVWSLAHARPEITDKDNSIFFRGRHMSLPNWEYSVSSGNVTLERDNNGQWVEAVNYSANLDFRWGFSQGILSFDNPLAAGNYRLHHNIIVEGISKEIELKYEFTVIPYDSAPEPSWNVMNMGMWYDEWHRPPPSENITIETLNPVLSMTNPELIISITADGEYKYGNYFLVYIVGNDWNLVPEIRDYVFNEEENFLSPNTEITQTIDLLSRFGVLPPGLYSLCYEMHLMQESPHGTNWELGSLEFTVEEVLDWLLFQ